MVDLILTVDRRKIYRGFVLIRNTMADKVKAGNIFRLSHWVNQTMTWTWTGKAVSVMKTNIHTKTKNGNVSGRIRHMIFLSPSACLWRWATTRTNFPDCHASCRTHLNELNCNLSQNPCPHRSITTKPPAHRHIMAGCHRYSRNIRTGHSVADLFLSPH